MALNKQSVALVLAYKEVICLLEVTGSAKHMSYLLSRASKALQEEWKRFKARNTNRDEEITIQLEEQIKWAVAEAAKKCRKALKVV